jgi:hypothetical protein
MASTYDTIDHVTLERLVEAGAVRGADVIGQPGGWGVVIKYGMVERALSVRRGAVRVFRKLETLVNYLREIGITQFTVNAANYDPAATTRPGRPDTSARMKRAHDAADHDKWFREQVEEALLEADKPDAVWIPHEEVVKDMHRQREAIKTRIAGKTS